MKRNGEVRLSTGMYALILGMCGIILFSYLTLEFTDGYGAGSVDEFDGYTAIYLNLSEDTKEWTNSQDAEVSESGNQSVIARWAESIKDAGQEYFADSLIVRGFYSISRFPKILGHATRSISESFSQIGATIPPVVSWMVFTILGLSVTIMFLRAYWEKKL